MSRSSAEVLDPQRPMPFQPDIAFVHLALDHVRPSKTNPRGKHEREALAELTTSVARHGVLQPVLVRPLKADEYELVAGHRRLAAAKAAGLGTIPATVREISDVEVLEIQVVENLQREGLTPLEEAEGYQRLLRAPGYDVEKVAERIGRSVKYVYDRMKLLALTKDAQALLLEEKITAGHAILLARLKPADQARAMKEGALFERQNLLLGPDEEPEPGETLKAVSVRELSDWIDKHVRFDVAKDADPILFPETAAALDSSEKPKVVAVTHAHYVPPEARDGKTFGPRSWKRADGKAGSKTCERSTLGFVAAGPHRGEAYEVCTAKDRCKVHWPAEVRAKALRAKASASKPAAPTKKAESPETAAKKAALQKALDNAYDDARAEISKQLGLSAAGCTPEEFIRCLARTLDGEVHHWAQAAGEKLKRGEVNAWITRAPVAQLQRAIVEIQEEYYEDSILVAFEVEAKAIRERFELAARESVSVQTSAPKPPKPAKSKPGAKRQA